MVNIDVMKRHDPDSRANAATRSNGGGLHVACGALLALLAMSASATAFAQQAASRWVGTGFSGFSNLHDPSDAADAANGASPVLRSLAVGTPWTSPSADDTLTWLGVRADGRLATWGYNAYGACQAPRELTDVVKAACNLRGIALRADGTVVTWGRPTDPLFPQPTLGRVVDVATSGDVHFAVTSDGALHAWGMPDAGIPADLGPIARIKARRHVAAIRTDGGLRCWGLNTSGQCDVPASVGTVLDVALGESHTVALRSDASVACFGSDAYGACTVPPGLVPTVEVAAGNLRSYALGSDGVVRLWGLGASSGPVEVLKHVSKIEACASSVAGLGPDGRVKVAKGDVPPDFRGPIRAIDAGTGAYAGINPEGGIVLWGVIEPEQRSVPVGLGAVDQVALGRSHVAVRRVDGSVVAWGKADVGAVDVPADLGPVIEVKCGRHRTAARTVDRRLVIWGYNQWGEGVVPRDVRVVDDFALGLAHNVAVLADGSVRAWGVNTEGQCNAPPALAGVRMVACSAVHSLALRADGSVAAWGSNSAGQSTVPAALSGVTDIAATGELSLALLADGSLRAWGSAGSPMLLENVVPADLPTVRSIIAGSGTLAYELDPCNRHVVRESGDLGPIGASSPREVRLEGVPEARGDVRITVEVSADLGGAQEYLTLWLNGQPVAELFRTGGSDCPIGTGFTPLDRETVGIPAATFNALLGNGVMVLRLEASALVDAAQCLDEGLARTLVTVDLAAADSDCDASGASDWCEIASGAMDSDRDGRLDSCERGRGDLNLDGVVDGGDIALVLASWGTPGDAAGDADGNSTVDGRDIAFVLARWGTPE
jgi:alpha-tubulin suppressor-like RCC1 family protein